MSTNHRFDQFAKELGAALSRRDAFRHATRWSAAMIGLPLGFVTLMSRSARGVPESTASLKSRMIDPAWTCRSTKVVRLDVDEDQMMDTPYARTCLHHVWCTSGAKKEQFVTACKAKENRCPSLRSCEAELDPQNKVMSMSPGKLSPEAAKPSSVKRFGSTCRYSWGGAFVLYRKHPEKSYWDTVCASPIEGCNVPDSIKGSFLATCKPVGELKVDGEAFQICPAVQDCLAKAIPVVVDPPMIPDAGK